MRACDGTANRSLVSDPHHFHDLWLRRAGEFKPMHPAAASDAPDIEIEFGLAA
jgi:hypothetical protein